MNLAGIPLPVDERFVSRRELADMIGVSVTTIDRWVKEGMPSDLFGRRTRRFQPSRAIAWARARTRPEAA